MSNSKVIPFISAYDVRFDSADYKTDVSGDSVTKQCFKDETDINNIIKQYKANGRLPELVESDPKYADYSSVPDFHEAMNIVVKAEEQFMSLSARVRSRFNNDPAELLAFLDDKENLEESYELGLRQKPVETKLETGEAEALAEETSPVEQA